MEQRIQTYNAIFWGMVNKYNTTDSNILRKIIHSFSVASTCFSIACRLGLDKNQREFAYLIGLFHDIGRFKQWELYRTYNDRISVDHGDLGEEILNEVDCAVFDLSSREYVVMKEAIKYHTKEYIFCDNEVMLYNTIVKNADSFCNVQTTANGAMQMTASLDGVTAEIFDDFMNFKLLLKYSPKTKLDRSLMLMAGAYYVKYDFLREEILNHNYIDIMFETFSAYLNEEDKQLFEVAKENLKNNYLSHPSIVKTK